ncbi:MAG TPA: CPBP family intramembrane metalloprotease [bacterium]|nr:CPBP family intramembrane metalloprotease [bacterium]HPJ71327.1 CPBP family intramembrane metalloprotease [bacterium]HPQ65658.1 CPBP family intramembrane metalloprotease [bacterium]
MGRTPGSGAVIAGLTVGISAAYYLASLLPGIPQPGAAVYQFILALVLMFAVPAAIIRRTGMGNLADYGWKKPVRGRELAWLAVGVPAVLTISWFSADQADFRGFYPLFGKEFPLSGANILLVVLLEISYLLYYIGWEFLYRGFALFGLKRAWGLVPAMVFQAAVSGAMHLHKPAAELAASFPAGVVFGLAALHCRSLRPVIVCHWLLGASLDLFILLRP